MVKVRQPNRARRAMPVTLSAPTGGLNGRDAYTDMPPNDAFRLDNWFPSNTSVDTRGGSADFATGMPGAVESVEVYTGGAGSKMLAFSDGDIYDVSLGGAVGAAIATGKVSNKVTTAMFSNAGSQFLLIYTGADAPMSYDGTTITDLVITGLTGSQDTLHSPMAFKGRMYIAQTGQLGFYYLAVGAIQGAASFFDLQQQSLKGGYTAAMVSFSEDSGAGPQDYAIFVSSEGEYIVYGGTDPSSAAAWSLVGRYYGPPPIGKKGWFRFRSDVYFITEEGIVSFSEIRKNGEAAGNTVDDSSFLTDKLGNLFKDAVTYQGTHGWCGMMYPRGNALYINVPRSGATSGEYTQFVMNTKGNKWCQYTDWDALCWTLFDRRAYFGTYDGRVVLADEGFTDNDAEIRCVARQAWNTFDDENGMGEADKHFHAVSFAMSADGQPAIACQLNVNFEDDQPQYSTPTAPAVGATWDLADWDAEFWSGAASTQNITVPVGKLGYIASPWMQAVSTAATIKWYATRIILEKTAGVLFQ